MISQVALFSLIANMAAAHILDIPTRVGNVIALPEASVITGSVDFGNKEFDRGHKCDTDDDTGSENAVFILQDGASISNVIIGTDALEGVHCLGSCTLTNVWFRDVCEDAISVLGTGDALIVGGGAINAIDKVVQHNGPGTVTIRDYTIVNAGKLYRSCGDCTNNSKKSPRKVIVENVKAFGLTSDLVGINPNFGDSATISGSCGQTKEVCADYQGVDKGNGKSQRLNTKQSCNGPQGKLEKLPECGAAEVPTPTATASSTPVYNGTLPLPTLTVSTAITSSTPVANATVSFPTLSISTLITKTSAIVTPTQGSGYYDGSYGGGYGSSNSVPLFGRCGGKGYTGPTTCRYGRCVAFNPWFSMCT